jgi:RND family efflux transporter MFP subunit
MHSSDTRRDKSGLLKKLEIDNRDREPQHRRYYPKTMAAVALLAVIGGAAVFYSQPIQIMTKAWVDPTKETAETVPVIEIVVSEQVPAVVRVLDATGYVTARLQATVSSRITGKIVDVYIEEGDEVFEGQLLARLDSAVQEAQYRLSESKLDAAQAVLLELEVQHRQAGLNLKRTQQLAERSLASDADLDQVALKREAIQARITRVNRDIDVANKVVQLQARQLAETEIRAPFAGVVINKAAQPGEIVSPISAGGGFTRTGICSLVDMNSLEIEVDVSESNINRVFSGQLVSVTLNAYPDQKYAAEVITIIPTADRNKATVRVRIKFLARDSKILPDMGVRVSFMESAQQTIK